MAELADAQVSGTCGQPLQVQILFPVPIKIKTNMKKTKLYLILSLIANLSIVIMEFFALNHHYVSGDGWELFKMYTQNSNIWLFLCSTLYVIFAIIALCRNSSTPKFVKILRYISTCSITLTFVLIYCYVLGITNFNETNSLFKWPMLAMHTVCPILSIISFVI